MKFKLLQQIAAVIGSIAVVWYVSKNYDNLKALAAK
jgi:hypothetical protein